MKQSAKRGFPGRQALALLLGLASVQPAQAQFPPDLGLWVEGDKIFLLTNSLSCGYAAADAAQLLVSTDGGHSWKRRGPRLPGYAFLFMYVTNGKAWIAGEHTAEGPGIDPFVLVPSAAGDAWHMRTIYQGEAELLRVAIGGDEELTAWIQHLHLSGLKGDWVGPVYLHRSRDGGETWKELGLARKQRVQGGAEFKSLSTLKDPLWRAISYQSKGFKLQHRETADGAWKTVSRFPALNCKNEDAQVTE